MAFWLMKTEPDQFSFDDLVAAKDSTECWDGIRNYQARNLLRDEFKLGDQVFIYHSRSKPPCIVGTAEVVREAYPDDTALDPSSKYFDPKSQDLGESRWCMVDVKAKKRLKTPLSLQQLRSDPALEGLALLQRGQRLSIQPVSQDHWRHILSLTDQLPL